MHKPLARLVATAVLFASQSFAVPTLAYFDTNTTDSSVLEKLQQMQSRSRAPNTERLVPGRLTIVFHEPLTDFQIVDLETRYGLEHIDPIVVRTVVSFMTKQDVNEVLTALSTDGLVISAAQDALLHQRTADPLFEDQWYLQNVGQSFLIGIARLFIPDEAIDELITTFHATSGSDIRWVNARSANNCDGRFCDGSGVTVAVIDSGVDYTHPDLQGQVDERSTSIVYSTGDPLDISGHGTFIAGLISAKTGNSIGIAGVAPGSKVLAIETSVSGSYTTGDILIALQYAVDSGADVINLSFGGSSYSSQTDSVIQGALNAFPYPIIVAAAGNEGDAENYTLYPASYDGVISVASYDPDGFRTPFSQHNSTVDISAPGGLVTSLRSQYAPEPISCGGTPYGDFLSYEPGNACTFDDNGNLNPDGLYRSGSGTSYATPIVSGAAALAKDKWPRITGAQFELLVRSTADDAGDVGFDEYYGYGKINLERLLSFNFPISIAQAGLSAPSVVVGGSTVATVLVDNMEGDSDVESVVVDLTPIGGSIAPLSRTSEAVYSATINVPSNAQVGAYDLAVAARDIAGQVNGATLSLTVVAEGTTLPPISNITTPSTEVSVEITSPKRGKDVVTRKDNYTLRGTIGSGVAFLEMNGVSITLAPGDTSWSADVELDKGDNDLEFVAYNVNRTSSDRAEVTVTRDTKAPGDVRNLKASGLKLTWESPKDKDVDGYRIYRKDGKKWKKVKAVTKEEFTVVAGGTYAVTAEDEAGNEADVDDAPTVSTGSPSTGSGGSLSPDRPVTRAEFAKLLAIAVNQEVGANASFNDVPASHSLSRYIAAVSKKGWASGQGGNFFPDRPITRMEAARMLLRAMGWKVATEESFADLSGEEDRIATTLKSHGVMRGVDGKFYPLRALTRREAESILAAATGK